MIIILIITIINHHHHHNKIKYDKNKDNHMKTKNRAYKNHNDNNTND